jgi:hypothetical protein
MNSQGLGITAANNLHGIIELEIISLRRRRTPILPQRKDIDVVALNYLLDVQQVVDAESQSQPTLCCLS